MRNGNSDAPKKNQTCHYPNTKDPDLEHWKGGGSNTQTEGFRGPVRPTSSQLRLLPHLSLPSYVSSLK